VDRWGGDDNEGVEEVKCRCLCVCLRVCVCVDRWGGDDNEGVEEVKCRCVCVCLHVCVCVCVCVCVLFQVGADRPPGKHAGRSLISPVACGPAARPATPRCSLLFYLLSFFFLCLSLSLSLSVSLSHLFLLSSPRCTRVNTQETRVGKGMREGREEKGGGVVTAAQVGWGMGRDDSVCVCVCVCV